MVGAEKKKKRELESDNSGLILHHPPVSSGKRASQHAQCSTHYEDQTFQQVSVVVLTASLQSI